MPTSPETTPEPIRVLILGLNYAPETTGIAPYTTGLARYLGTQGHSVTVVAGHPHYPEWRLHSGYDEPRPPTDEHGVHLIRVKHPVPSNPTGFSRIAMELSFATRSTWHLFRHTPDVVIVISPALLALLPAILLRSIKGSRVGLVVQDLYGAALAETGLSGGLVARLTARLELLLFHQVDGISVIHDVFRRRLTTAGVHEDKIRVIPNWAHVNMPTDADRAASRAALGWSDDEFIALHAGNMGAKQGLEGLLDVARLADQLGSSVRVILLGNGSRHKALTLYAEGITRATFLDPLPEGQFEAALAAADCLLLHEKPGVVEMSVPSKLTTYFSSGRPIVAATDANSGAASLMASAHAGFTVQAGNPTELLNAIEVLAEDSLTAQQYGLNGQRYAEEHLTGAQSLALYDAWVRSLHRYRTRASRDHGKLRFTLSLRSIRALLRTGRRDLES